MPTMLHASWRDSAPAKHHQVLDNGVRQAHWAPRPGPLWGGYPMLNTAHHGQITVADRWRRWRHFEPPPSVKQRQVIVRGVLRRAEELATLDQASFAQCVQHARLGLVRHGLGRSQLIEPLSVVAEALRRASGLTVRDTQVHAAVLMLANALVELATGEGKSVVAVLTAGVAALAGVPVHVLTANDYLAARDAESWAPVYKLLGLRVGLIQAGDEPDTRRQAYQCEVVHASAREVAFDHLRDRLGAQEDAGTGQGHERPVLRGLCMAVLDEADGALVDEASVPMILSRQVADDLAQRHRVALFLARQMQVDVHAVEHPAGCWQLTEMGRDWLRARAQSLGGDWRLRRWREEIITQALAALHSHQRDVHYVVHEGEIQIVDAYTGRRAEGRHWSRGLHQLVALKEGLSPAPLTQTLQQLSYQQFFPRYLRLCGQSGTLWEARAEMLAVYGTPVVQVAPHRPARRTDRGVRVCDDDHALWRAVAERVSQLQADGLPVLVGTRSVAESDEVASALRLAGLAPRVLNARDDADEAGIVARAGQPGAITVATQMAGRGTDIPVPEAVAARGGLQVLSVGVLLSGRVARQLAGRAGRGGQPGAHERWISRDDALWRQGPWWVRTLVAICPASWSWAWSWILVSVQAHHARAQVQQRWQGLAHEGRQGEQLAWTGRHPWDR